MKWAFTIRNKFKMAALLLVVFTLVLIRHFAERRHVSELGSSFSSVYKDRLMVEGYIFQLSNHLHRKKMSTDKCDVAANNQSVAESIHYRNGLINELIVSYEQTELTSAEAVALNRLKHNLERLTSIENSYLNRLKYGFEPEDLKEQLEKEFNEASGNLHQLSEIQLAVGKQMNNQSREVLSEASIFSRFDITLLIIIGLLIQVLIFSSRDTAISRKTRIGLN